MESREGEMERQREQVKRERQSIEGETDRRSREGETEGGGEIAQKPLGRGGGGEG